LKPEVDKTKTTYLMKNQDGFKMLELVRLSTRWN